MKKNWRNLIKVEASSSVIGHFLSARGCAFGVRNLAAEFDVVIAGSGIAGMTGALTSARLGRTTLVLTGDVFGGQLAAIEKIEGFPGFPDGVAGSDLCPMLQQQAATAGAEFLMTGLERIEPQHGEWRVTTAERDIAARAVILATGSTLKKLDVPGEERLTGKGVSQCASCDAPLFRDRIVAVVGGGDSAMQEALTIAEFASRVIIVHRRGALMGQASYRDRVTSHGKIDIRPNTTVNEILGETCVTGLRIHDSSSAVGADLATAAVFAYVGLQPNSANLADLLNLDPAGRIPTDDWMRTELIGVCAAGNVRSQSPYRAVSAAGDGASAAIAVDRYLADDTWRPVTLKSFRREDAVQEADV
jgi:thioredoxin reductase (NADPH)